MSLPHPNINTSGPQCRSSVRGTKLHSPVVETQVEFLKRFLERFVQWKQAVLLGVPDEGLHTKK